MRKIYSFLLLAMLLFVACEWRLGSSGDNPDWMLSVSRYDRVQSLYLTTGDFSALQQMNTEYPQQTRTLIEDVLHLGRVNDPQINTKFLSFYQDTTLQAIIQEASLQYTDMSDVNQELSDAFERLLKELPGLCIPEVYAQIGSLDQSIIVGNDMLGISLDKYLGCDYSLYKKYGYSQRQRETMQRSYIVPDCIGFYLLSLFPIPSDSTVTQQQREEHIGRIQWVVNRVVKRNVFNTPHVHTVDQFMRSHKKTSVGQLLRLPQ